MELLVPFVESFSPQTIAFSGPDNPSESPQLWKEKKQSAPKKKRVGNRVLIVGRLRELAIYRAEFLRQAGFNVVTAVDPDEALPIIQHGRFDAIILSYTLSSHTVRYLANATRDYCPDCVIVAIAETRTFDCHIEPDAVVIADEGPVALVSALKRVLQQS